VAEKFVPAEPLVNLLRLDGVPVYALIGVERGEEFRGVPPEDALPAITGRGRTPLTIQALSPYDARPGRSGPKAVLAEPAG
jgi:hypothetical protein